MSAPAKTADGSLGEWLAASAERKAEQVEQHAAETRRRLRKASVRLASVASMTAVRGGEK